MRTREVTVPWNEMLEGDLFLRYEERDPSDKVVVERQVPDLPQMKGSIGYASVDWGGEVEDRVLIVRIYGPGSTHPRPWVAPSQTGDRHNVSERNIVEFTPMDLVPVIDCRTLEDAIVEGSSGTRKHLEFVGVNVRGIYNAVTNLLHPSE